MGNCSLLPVKTKQKWASLHIICLRKSNLKFQPKSWYKEEDWEDVPKQIMTLKGKSRGEMSIYEWDKACLHHHAGKCVTFLEFVSWGHPVSTIYYKPP